MPENKNAGAKAQHHFVALSAVMAEAMTYQSCPDTFCLRKVILQEAPGAGDFRPGKPAGRILSGQAG
jgi:hypothetical protein